MPFVLILLGLFCFSEKTKAAELAEKEFWLQVLHYKKNRIGSGYTSDVKNHSFFLSVEGHRDPKAELEENIKQFSLPLTKENAEKNAICRFPARYKWIAKELKWDIRSTDFKLCKKYFNWTLNGKITSISVVFATGYFANPASYFGHPLIKFNSSSKNGKLLDVSVNYGAMTPENENPIIYIFKGLFGGYEATFSNSQFFYHHHSYTESELRDLWEYELNLNPEAVEIIVDHSWEMLGMQIPYLFLSDNCAYRMSELLELAIPIELVPKPRPYAIPNTLFYNLGNFANEKGEKLYTKVTKIPSRQERMTRRFFSLNEKDREVVVKIVNSKNSQFSLEKLSEFPEDERIKIVETMIEYYSFQIAKNKEDQSLKERKKSLILARLQLPKKERISETILNAHEDPSPHEGRSAFALKVENVNSKYLGMGQQLEIRFALYDFLTMDRTHPKNTSLEIVKLKLAYWRQEIELRNVDLFSVTHLNTSKTNLPGDGGMAWSVKVGLWPQTIFCRNCSVFGLRGAIGYGYELNPNLIVYTLFALQAQENRENFGSYSMGPVGGVLYDWNKYIKTHLTFTHDSFVDGERQNALTIHWENRLNISRNIDLNISYLEQIDQQYFVGLNATW